MKNLLLITSLVALIVFPAASPLLAENAAVATEMKNLVTQIQTKIRAHQSTAADLAPELKAFDALLAKHSGEQTEEVAQVLMMKAMLYSEVLKNETKGDQLLDQLMRDFPDTKIAASVKRQAAARKIQTGLVAGAAFPDFSVKDLAGKPLSVGGCKGKVVLVDFWATWCGPCVGELPNVLASYQKHHAQGFEVIGISLDKERETLETFLKKKGVVWPQFFDGQGWQNELAQKYGVNSIPATYLLDRQGKIIAKGLRGDELEAAIVAALKK
jgi:thiol-disulfide isomerase/thioredoxin